MKIYQADASGKIAGESIPRAVKTFYHSLIKGLDQTTGYCRWELGAHPSDEMLEAAINQKELYLGVIDQRIAACMMINLHGDGYPKAAWDNEIAEGEYLVIHILGVHQDFRRRGLAKEMVQFAIDLARREKKRAIRLDVLKGNLPAEEMYTSLGFRYIDTISLYYESTGWADFELFEYLI